VGIETIRLAMVLASTKGLQVCAADVGNVFLYADNKEKTKIIAGPEFGALEGKTRLRQQGFMPTFLRPFDVWGFVLLEPIS
jgi:hypothetical protein